MKKRGFWQGARRKVRLHRSGISSSLLLRQWILSDDESKADSDRGFALPIAIVAALVLTIGVMALSSRSNQGFLSNLFQAVNREARDIAESAILEFGVTMNREENRLLLIAGNGTSWADPVNRNICTASTLGGDGTWSTVSSASVAAPVNLGKFTTLGQWQSLLDSDSTRQFKVTRIEYLYEDAGGERSLYGFNDENTNFPSNDPADQKTVRDTALEGGTRTLLRVTVVARVNRNGQQSYARVAREFEIVPKCCKRSFGNNIGAISWGRDNALCPVSRDTGVGNGLIGSMSGGLPRASNNELDIRNEDNELITQALCWAGNDSGVGSDLTGSPNANCLNGSQALGQASKNKTSVSFIPTKFSFKLPDPKFRTGGRLAPQYGSLLTLPILRSQFPIANVGTWISDSTSSYWVKLLVETGQPDWQQFSMRSVRPLDQTCQYGSLSPVIDKGPTDDCPPTGLLADQLIYLDFESGNGIDGLYFYNGPVASTSFELNADIDIASSVDVRLSRAFSGCNGSTSDISLCRWEFNRIPATPPPPFPQVDSLTSDSIILGIPANAIPRATKTYSSDTRIYFDPNTFRLLERRGSGTPVPLTNCVITKAPAAPYVVADCRFSSINAGNNVVVIDTSYAMINFHFDDADVVGDYMGGNGNTVYQRVHCARSGWTPSCSDLVTWADFQIKCDTGVNSDPNCSAGKNSNYDHSELFNAFSGYGGGFNLNGSNSTVGLNVYAPFASVTLKGGGNADPNFMGRIWTDTIALNGNVKLRVPISQPSFCKNTPCPPPSKVPLFDVVARSFSHASGF